LGGAPTQVRVTAEHITRGRPGSCERCPVALAITAATCACYVSAAASTFTILTGTGQLLTYRTPPLAAAFITAFDAAQPVAPFQFTMPRHPISS
jgi:hypothetical protein